MASQIGRTRRASDPCPRIASPKGKDDLPVELPPGFPSVWEWDRAIDYMDTHGDRDFSDDERILLTVDLLRVADAQKQADLERKAEAERLKRQALDGEKLRRKIARMTPPLLGPPRPPEQSGKKWATVPTRTWNEDMAEYRRQLRVLKKYGTLYPEA